MNEMLRSIGILIQKDLRAEWRSKEQLSALLVFGVLMLLVYNFAFPPGVRQVELLAPGILWTAFLYAGMLGLNRSLAREKEEGCLYGLLLTPVDRGALFLAKLVANFLFLGVMEVILLVVFVFFFSIFPGDALGGVLAMMVLGSLGFVTLGTLFAAMAVQTRYQEVLMPVLMIPMAAPILIGAVKGTMAAWTVPDPEGFVFWVKFLLTFDGVFLVVGFLGFEFVVQE